MFIGKKYQTCEKFGEAWSNLQYFCTIWVVSGLHNNFFSCVHSNVHHCTFKYLILYSASTELLNCCCFYCATFWNCTQLCCCCKMLNSSKWNTKCVIIFLVKCSKLDNRKTNVSLYITKPPSPIWVTRTGPSIDAFPVRWLSNCVSNHFGGITCTQQKCKRKTLKFGTCMFWVCLFNLSKTTPIFGKIPLCIYFNSICPM